MLELIKKCNLALSKRLSKSKQNAKYTNLKIQNEFLNLMTKEVQRDIVNKINKAQFFTIIVDSAIDLSRVEQISLSIKFVNEICMKDFLLL